MQLFFFLNRTFSINGNSKLTNLIHSIDFFSKVGLNLMDIVDNPSNMEDR